MSCNENCSNSNPIVIGRYGLIECVLDTIGAYGPLAQDSGILYGVCREQTNATEREIAAAVKILTDGGFVACEDGDLDHVTHSGHVLAEGAALERSLSNRVWLAARKGTDGVTRFTV